MIGSLSLRSGAGCFQAAGWTFSCEWGYLLSLGVIVSLRGLKWLWFQLRRICHGLVMCDFFLEVVMLVSCFTLPLFVFLPFWGCWQGFVASMW